MNKFPPLFAALSSSNVMDSFDEAYLKHFFNNSWEICLVVDADGIIQHYNPEANRHFGNTYGSTNTPYFPALHHPDDYQLVESTWRQMVDRAVTSQAFRARLRTGAFVEWRLAALSREQAGWYCAIGRDVTRERQALLYQSLATEALHPFRGHLPLVVEHMTDMVTLHDPDGTIRYVSPASETMTGFVPSELVGTNAYDYFHPEDLEHIREYSHFPVLESNDRIQNVRQIAFRHRQKDGTYRWLEADSKPIIANNEVVNIIISSRDISARKRAEREALDYQAKLKRSNEELKNFAYVASHDLQEPLRMVSSYLQLLRMRYGGQLTKEADEFIDFAVDGAQRMKKLIEAILEYSKIEQRFEKRQNVNLDRVLDVVTDNLSVLIRDNAVTLSREALPVVKANEVLMILLFQNLVSNGIKFRSEKPVLIDVSVVEESDAWIFAVRDNGIGIPEKYQEQVFAIFRRLQGTSSGAGIGLSMVKKVVHLHGGKVWLNSKPGDGTTVFFSIGKE